MCRTEYGRAYVPREGEGEGGNSYRMSTHLTLSSWEIRAEPNKHYSSWKKYAEPNMEGRMCPGKGKGEGEGEDH